MEIQLRLVNRSDDAGGADVVIFQKNLADAPDAPAVAWLLVSDFAPGQTYAFAYPMSVTTAATDPWGHAIPEVSAEAGESFTVQSSARAISFAAPAWPAAPARSMCATGWRRVRSTRSCIATAGRWR